MSYRKPVSDTPLSMRRGIFLGFSCTVHTFPAHGPLIEGYATIRELFWNDGVGGDRDKHILVPVCPASSIIV
jgi:hypothetical protein